MTRIASAGASKALFKEKRVSYGRIQKAIPREGTKLRGYYDALRKNPGAWVQMPPEFAAGLRDQLTNFYGMDIISRVGRGRPKGNKPGRTHPHTGQYRLAGEWVGVEYIAYPEPKTKEVPP